MSPLRRSFVALLLAGILAAQARVTVPPDRDRGWYWPFLSYPMYQRAHHEGDEILFTKLEGIPCGPGEPIELTHEDLGIQWFNLNLQMTAIVESRALDASGPARQLRDLVAAELPGTICAARIYTRSLFLGDLPDSGIEGVPWTLRAELDIP